MQHNYLLNTLVLKTNKLRRLQEQVQKVDENKAVKRSVGTDVRFFIEELPDEAGQAAARDVMSVVWRIPNDICGNNTNQSYLYPSQPSLTKALKETNI